MNLEKIMPFVISIVIAAASVGKIDVFQKWIWKAQATILYEARASNWGSPSIFRKSK